MKKFLILLIAVFALCSNCYSQVGNSDFINLQNGSFLGSLWEPRGMVTYDSKQYGLTFCLRTSNTYLDILSGHKVSIEFKDGTREIYNITNSDKNYSNTVANHIVIDIYTRIICINPNFEKLCSTEISKFVIQRSNGNVWIIDVKPKRAKKMLKEFKEAMEVSKKSYNTRVNNNNYFN